MLHRSTVGSRATFYLREIIIHARTNLLFVFLSLFEKKDRKISGERKLFNVKNKAQKSKVNFQSREKK